MKVVRISYRRIRALKPFENAQIEATVDLEPGDDVDAEMEKLRTWVKVQLGFIGRESKPDLHT